MSAEMFYGMSEEETQQANYHQINQELQERRMNDEVRLWKVKERETEKHPNYSGNGLVAGKEYDVKMWMNVSKKGDTWLKLKFEEPWKKTSGGGDYNPPPAPAPSSLEDPPF